MRAAVRTRYGPPSVVRVEEVERPRPGAGELLVRVRATTVNRTDCGYRAGTPWPIRAFTGVRRPRIEVLGTEFAGDVVEVGAGVEGTAPGDRVFGYSEPRLGAHAEFIVVAANGLVAPIPDGWAYRDIAPATEGWHYALSGVEKSAISAGDRVLVNGATGAIGSAAVQILRSRDAHVTAVCGPDHVDLVRELGAHRVIDRSRDDFTRLDETFDVVYDAVGKSTFGRCRHLLRAGGIYATTDLGPWWQNVVLVPATALLPGKRATLPTPLSGLDVAVRAKEMIEAGRFRPLVDRVYPLDEIVEAHEYVASGQKIGNVVIEVAAD